MHTNTSISESSLREAVCWCNWALANGGFVPDEFTAELDDLSPTDWSTRIFSDVERLLKHRREKFDNHRRSVQRCMNWPGTILAFYPNFSMHDGISQSESGGLFDVHGCPIYDFWIGASADVEPKILCWIPQPIREVVVRAMQVDAAKCLAWLGEEWS